MILLNYQIKKGEKIMRSVYLLVEIDSTGKLKYILGAYTSNRKAQEMMITFEMIDDELNVIRHYQVTALELS